jgi:CHASE2 domain-containing sensor protein
VTGEPVWQDSIYTHTLTPSTDIVIIAIDEQTLNTLQSQSDTKNLIIPKSVYTDLVNRLEGV